MSMDLTGLCSIGGTDIYTNYGAFLAETSADAHTNMDALLAMPAVKEYTAVDFRERTGEDLPDSRVLERKRPINFILHDPTRIEYIDATMALHNAGALYLIEHPHAQGLIEPPHEIEEELLEVSRRNGTIAEELQYI